MNEETKGVMDPLLLSIFEKTDKYITKEENRNLIEKAYFFSKKMHEGQIRKTGEPYITHPVAVTKILAELGVGPATLAAGLLHDVVEDTTSTLEELSKTFGKDIADMVDGVTKIGQIKYKDASKSQSENHQKMLIAMANDIRIVLIKIADRLHNMRTLSYMDEEHQKKISKETLEIYAPLAHRLGMFRIKAELEDISLRYTSPELYHGISRLVQVKKSEREDSIDNIIKKLTALFKTNDLEAFDIVGRVKNIHSIYKKMTKDSRDFEDIYDLLAIRVIVSDVKDCYQALGVIHANFTPIPKRFKDYIAVPKPNLYQSLHTTVLASDGNVYEIQIRTHAMDLIAEYGVAAHWAYKENKDYSKEKEQFEIASTLKWYGDLLRFSEESEESAEEFVETIKGDILTSNVYVFTPQSEVIELPGGSTPIDFAYRIHSDVGNKMTGATVNSKISTIDRPLKTGDIVSIRTSNNSSGPSEGWLKIAKSSHARTKIRNFLNKKNRDIIIARGRTELEREMIANSVDELPNDKFIKKNFSKNNANNLEELFLEIGKGILSEKTVIAKMLGKEIDKEQLLQRQMQKASRQLVTHSETGVQIEGISSPQMKLSNCCMPIPGDDIIGFVSKTAGISIHKKDCPNVLAGLDINRLLEISWGEEITRKYPALISVLANARDNILAEIVTVINSVGVSVAEISIKQTSAIESIVKAKVLVKSLDDLTLLMVNLRKISDVFSVERLIT